MVDVVRHSNQQCSVVPVFAQILTSRCGHHCGVQTTQGIRQIGHCSCGECHAEPTGPMSITRVAVA